MNTSEGILRPGELLNNTYVIEKLIGSGGTGEVYLAKNIVSGRKFAIKILKQEFSQNEAFINLMRREADVLHNVINDAVVRYNELLKSEMHGGFVFLVMEFIEGQQLAEIMQASGGMAPEALLQIAHRMGQGLAAAHAQNAFHRDISPDNIILPGGDPAKAKLIDFGIARDISENAHTVVGGGFAGKYQYASPEQLHGDVDARSDLYSLGITLLNTYRGKSSKIGSSFAEISQTKAQRIDTRDVPGKLGALISRLVEPRPEDRFQSATEMVQWLEDGTAAPATEPAMIVPPGTRPAFQALPEEGPRGGFGKFALLLVLLALGGAGWYFGLGPGRAGLFAPEYEAASPYTMRITREADSQRLTVAGHVQGPDAGTALADTLQNNFSAYTINTELQNASGAPSAAWEQAVAALAGAAKPLDAWVLEVSDRTATLTGEAGSETVADAVRTTFAAAASAQNMVAGTDITSAPPPLPLAPLAAQITPFETCGPLRVSGGDGTRLGPEDRLTVSGIIARESDVDVIDLVLSEAAPNHGIDYNLGVLNPPVCEIEALLPPPQNNGMELVYSYGQREGTLGNSPYREGENPVIDLRLPAGAQGFLYVFYVDAEGQVYHFLPHNARQSHTVPPLGSMVDGKRQVRLTYPYAEASTERLGFRVASPFGTNMVVAMLTPRPLFDGLRPREESIAALQEALAPKTDIIQDPATMVVSRYLVTAP